MNLNFNPTRKAPSPAQGLKNKNHHNLPTQLVKSTENYFSNTQKIVTFAL
jgi:hypothetical protein